MARLEALRLVGEAGAAEEWGGSVLERVTGMGREGWGDQAGGRKASPLTTPLCYRAPAGFEGSGGELSGGQTREHAQVWKKEVWGSLKVSSVDGEAPQASRFMH